MTVLAENEICYGCVFFGSLHLQFLFHSHRRTHVLNVRSWRISSRWTALNAGLTHWLWVWLKKKLLHFVLGHCVSLQMHILQQCVVIMQCLCKRLSREPLLQALSKAPKKEQQASYRVRWVWYFLRNPTESMS